MHRQPGRQCWQGGVSGSAVEPSLGGAFKEKYILKLCKYTVLYTVESTPHPIKVANKVKFLGIPYTKKYNLYTLIMVVAGILGRGGDMCTQVLEHAAALERSSTQNRAALMRSSCDRKNCRLMGFWRTHRIHGTGIFVPIYIYHKNQANLGKYTIDYVQAKL